MRVYFRKDGDRRMKITLLLDGNSRLELKTSSIQQEEEHQKNPEIEDQQDKIPEGWKEEEEKKRDHHISKGPVHEKWAGRGV